ncbi:MAG: SGNH/GDSL hydrolase family protein [Candidatus Krumholzibacteriia bacterium]
MKKTLFNATLTGALLALLLAGCSLDDPTEISDTVNPPTAAEAGTPYLAIGNSLTAGFMDAGLMVAGQGTSFPALIAMQLGMSTDPTVSGAFTQPFINAPGIGSSDVGEGLVSGVLHFDGEGVVPLGVTAEAAVPGLLLAAAVPTQYNNLGVPGARLIEARTVYSGDSSFGAQFGSPNSFFDFINRASFFGNVSMPADATTGFPAYESASQLWQAIARGPALVTLWLGANDVLSAGLSGEPTTYPLVTDPTAFGAEYGQLLGALAGGLAARNGRPSTIVVGTVPNINNSAYFLPKAAFEAVFGAWPMTETDVQYVLILDFLSWFDPTFPGVMPADMTLDTEEVAYLSIVIGGYNAGISGAIAYLNANKPGIARFGIMDVNAALDALTAEQKQHFLYLRAVHGTETVAETAARTYFSLDGVHPNQMGYAYVAGKFMDAIEAADDSYSFDPAPPAAFTWDPTYANYGGGKSADASDGFPRVDPALVASIKSFFK